MAQEKSIWFKNRRVGKQEAFELVFLKNVTMLRFCCFYMSFVFCLSQKNEGKGGLSDLQPSPAGTSLGTPPSSLCHRSGTGHMVVPRRLPAPGHSRTMPDVPSHCRVPLVIPSLLLRRKMCSISMEALRFSGGSKVGCSPQPFGHPALHMIWTCAASCRVQVPLSCGEAVLFRMPCLITKEHTPHDSLWHQKLQKRTPF